MKHLVILAMSILLLAGCTYPKVRSSLNTSLTKPNPRIGIMSNHPLGDAIGTELVHYGFTVIERGRIQAVLEELKFNLSGVVKEGDMRRVGEILSVDALMFIAATSEPDFLSKVGSATIKLVDAEKGILVGGVTYQNGRGGAPGSPADSGMKESLPETAERIGKEIAIAYGKAAPGFF